MTTPRGRFAPSPTGRIHLGNARTALVTWLSARAAGGRLVWRLEDIDSTRAVPGLADTAERDLAWLGLDWDEGPTLGGASGPYVQSERIHLYEAALDRLDAVGRLFPCRLTRRDLEGIASAPHGHDTGPAYPPHLRPQEMEPGWLEALRLGRGDAAAVRFAIDDTPTSFTDRIAGRHTERVNDTCGHFVVRRRDGVFAYQLAVVVDDLAMGIDDVVRGADLIDSTARQIQLIEALGGSRPRYAHVPLVKNPTGEKLSKRDAVAAIASLRSTGLAPEQIVGYLAWSLGMLDRAAPCSPRELVSAFDWARISARELVLPEDVEGSISRV